MPRKIRSLVRFFHAIEALESRRMLSVTAQQLYAPIAVKGTQWTYTQQVQPGDTATLVDTVAGPATFQGQSVTEVDTVATDDGTTEMATQYVGFTAAGFVTYGQVEGTSTISYSPALVNIPASLSAGQTYSTADTQTDVTTNSTGTSTEVTDEQETFSLASDTPTSIAVPLGTLSAYQLNVTDIQTDVTAGSQPSTDTYSEYAAVGYGFISGDDTGGQNGFNGELAAFKSAANDLAVTTQPQSSSAGEPLESVVVSIEDSQGNVDTTSTSAVTVALLATAGGTGQLKGTTTISAVNGVATFKSLSVDKGGTYELAFTDADNDTAVNSQPFQVAGYALKPSVATALVTAGFALKPTFSVEQVTAKGKPIKTDSSTVVTLGATVGSEDLIAGSNTATMVDGRATFTNLVFTYPGKYTLQITDSSNDTPAKLMVTIFHGVVKFIHLRARADAQQPFAYGVEVLGEDKRINTNFTGDVTVSLNVLPSKLGSSADHVSAQLIGTTTVAVVNGEAQFTLAQADAITEPGTYTLTAAANSATDAAVSASQVTPGTSTAIQVEPLKLMLIVRPPRTVSVNQPLAFEVEIRTAENAVISSSTAALLSGVNVSEANTQNGLPTTAYVSSLAPFSGINIATFPATGSGLSFTQPGTFILTIEAVDTNGLFVDSITPVEVGPITVVTSTK